MNANEVVTAINAQHAATGEYHHYGLRLLSDNQINLAVGAELDNSWQSDDYSEPRELNGACVIGIGYCGSVDEDDHEYDMIVRAISRVTTYSAGVDNPRYALVSGTGYEHGWDDGEWIISSPEIVALW